MNFASLSLGERIILVARLAAEAHPQVLHREECCVGRPNAGGAGCMAVTDDFAAPHARRDTTLAPSAEGEGQ